MKMSDLQKALSIALVTVACAAGIASSEVNAENGPTPARNPGEVPDVSALKMPAALAAAGFTKFAKAVEAAGLNEALEEENEFFTCFAPSDKAYDAMPEETRKMLEEDPAGEKSQAWVKYHFVKGAALKQEDLQGIPGANGFADKYLRIWVTPGRISVNRVCEIIRFDIRALNGFIHEVDRALDSDDEMKVNQSFLDGTAEPIPSRE